MNQAKKDALNNRFWIHLVFLLVIIILTFSAYSNVLHGEFLFDDRLIDENKLPQSPSAFKDLNIWNPLKSGGRPAVSFTFSLNHYFFGKDTFSYHLTNVIIHILNGMLVYLFIYITLVQNAVLPTTPAPPYQGGDKGKVRDDRQWIAFIAALFFSLHPIQAESVSYIIQRYESMSSMFYLISLIVFIFASKLSTLRPLIAVVLYIIFILGFVLAIGSKEIAVTIPVTAFLYGVYFFERKGLWKKVVVPGLLIVAGVAIAINRVASIGGESTVGYGLKKFTALEYLFTEFNVIVTYLRLLILPVGQNMDHVYPISRTFLEPGTVISFTLLLSVILMAVILFERWRAGSFFVLWFFIIISPTSTILPINDVIAEHRLYLPSVGIFFIAASGMVWIFERFRRRHSVLIFIHCVLLMLVTAILWSATYRRNFLWNSRIAMWQDVVKKAPDNDRGHDSLGLAYQNKGLFEKAVEQHEYALRLKPYYDPSVYNNLGVAYLSLGKTDIAMQQFVAALKVDMSYSDAYSEIGIIYEKQGRYEDAIHEFQTAIKLKPDDSTYHYNLGTLYYRQKRFSSAIREYQTALSLKPDFADAYNSLGYVYYEQGRLQDAVRELHAALRLNPDDPNIHLNCGLVYDKQGLQDDAIKEFQTAIRLNPDFVDARYHIGMVYLKRGLNDKAMNEFEAVLRLKPDHPEAVEAIKSTVR